MVDDSASFREMVVLTLTDAGYSVLQGANGKEALDRLGEKRVDVIITDLNMPVMDGVTLVQNLRAKPQCKATPILILTTESQVEKRQQGKAAGATGWIVKPFKPEQLLQVLDEIVP